MRPHSEHPKFADAFPSLLTSLPANATPLQVIQAVAEHWQANTDLHHGLSASDLLAVVIEALHAAGIGTVAMQKGWGGPADIVVAQDHRNSPAWVQQQGRALVANSLLWDGPSELREALDRLLGQLTKADRHAAIVIFVRQGGLANVMQTARFVCEKHPAFGNFGKAVEGNQLLLWLSVSKNPDKVIPTTLLFCDLFDGARRGGIDEPGEPEPWEPEFGGMY